MDTKQAIAFNLSSSEYLVNGYLADLQSSDLLVRPTPGANHIAWQLGHLIASERYLVERRAPGTMDALGTGYDVLKTINPRLIYATGTGFGISGPDRDNLAMDFTIQAASGIMSITGDPSGPPMKAGPTLVDFMGGIHLTRA